MLEMRPVCENCGKSLPNESDEAMICTFECTFCADCVENVLLNVCPNCGGGLERRPTRPAEMLGRHPASSDPLIKPIDEEKFRSLLERYQNTDPRKR